MAQWLDHADEVETLREDDMSSLLQLHMSTHGVVPVTSASAHNLPLLNRQTFSTAANSSHKKPGQGAKLPPLKQEPLDGGVPYRVWRGGLWLYNPTPGSCAHPVWDFTEHSILNRIAIPALFCMVLACVVAAGTHAGTQEIAQDTTAGSDRRYDLDFFRIICISCVVTEHSGGKLYADTNVFLVAEWVLPYLYLTSAISWRRSKRSLLDYELRVFVIVLVGVLANFIADVICGRDWQTNSGDTLFQMVYAIMLFVMAPLTFSLREALTLRADGVKRSGLPWRFFISLIFFGALSLVGLVCFAGQQHGKLYVFSGNTWLQQSGISQIFSSLPICLIQVAGILFISHVACLFAPNNLLPWCLIAHIFIPRVLAPWEKVAFVHTLELYILGIVADSPRWRMRGEKTIQLWARDYWPFILTVLLLAFVPGAVGRCDLTPPASMSERVRFYGSELVLCLLLCSESFKLADPYKCLPWLSYWALYAYCFHVAFARIFPIPVGAFVIYGSIVFFYLYNVIFGTQQLAPKGASADTMLSTAGEVPETS
jgi:hypothetical protein